MSRRPPETAAPPAVDPSIQHFLQAKLEARARHQRRERLLALRQERFVALQALAECAHQIQRLPQPSPDRPSPGVDVEAWVREPMSTAADGLRKLTTLLQQPLAPVLKAAIPSTYKEDRKSAVKAMEELFLMLLEAKPKTREAAIQRAVNGLSVLVTANDGHAGAFAHWFEYAAFHLGSKLERIPLEAMENEAELHEAAKRAFEDDAPLARAASGRGRKRSRDHALGKRIDDAMQTGLYPRVGDACRALNVDPDLGKKSREAYRKGRGRRRLAPASVRGARKRAK